MSKLYFRYGAMNSGKSTHLMQVAYNYEERGLRVVLLKPATDKKGGDKLISRLGVTRKVDMVIDREDDIYERVQEDVNNNGKLDCILVDEKFNNNLKKIDPKVYKHNLVGQYAWKLENVVKYEEPIEIKGKLGLWNYEKN